MGRTSHRFVEPPAPALSAGTATGWFTAPGFLCEWVLLLSYLVRESSKERLRKSSAAEEPRVSDLGQ